MSRSNDIHDCLFWYNAEMHDDFRVGKRTMWEFHYKMKKNMVDKEDEDPDDEYLADLVGKNVTSRHANIKKLLP